MQFDILTLFPDIIYNYTDESILGRAQKQGIIKVRAHNFRAFANNKWRHVDEKPYGGGPGMILQVEPIYECLKSIGVLSLRGARKGDAAIPLLAKPVSAKGRLLRSARNDKTKVIVMDPAGKKFDQRMAEKYSKLDRLVFICGRYEGFDARIYKLADERVSVGDYVLAGGELPALTIVEAVSRLIPGVLGNEESLAVETFGTSTHQHINTSTRAEVLQCSSVAVKEYPQYTRPENFMGMKVPPVLLSGNHKEIEEWRRKQTK
ncbi:MAG: tRNA (guanosine(37)-N1)-methyltransferase TrmD [Candidatus Magasanikbacteria bacterium]|nr:tRNA (guanosine(37)-N1)-methyltransferase TrmD [Candidatus Magasanikbacteria bacterium]